ncbi:MAG: GH92 family glycosyl hydrolase [Prevotella sp.]|nr:GH92 family glycosyl hydrolase [Prevotella sp.]
MPEGYTPFYISHYGRHGSRWLPSDSRYEWVLRQFDDADNLTRKGRSVRKRLQRVWDNARGNGGQLTPLGAQQHRDIADRMLGRFPQLFSAGAKVKARSSVVNRCRRSMEAFVGEMGQKVPGINIDMATDSADMRWMSYDSPDEMLLLLETQVPLGVSPVRLMASLFKDPSKVKSPAKLLTELHTIASDMQDVEGLKVSLFDIFTREEMEAVYRQNCARMWHQNGMGAESMDIPAQCAARLWQNIVDEADTAIDHGTPAATLRFGHDTGLYRLLSLLKVSSLTPNPSPVGEESGYSADKVDGTVLGPLDEIVPMAANLQLVFCRDRQDRVMVGFWHNEKPVTLTGLKAERMFAGQSWYAWTAVKKQYEHYLIQQQWKDRTQAVNTMVGTDYAVTRSVGRYGKGSEEHGQTLPAVLEPHGQTFWTPQTQDTEIKCVAPYYYRDSLFQGFRASHWLVGGCTQDYGSFTLMPMMNRLQLKPEARAVRFRHEDEISHPYYYALYLPDEHLMTEMTARSHSAIFRFMPDIDGEMHIVVNPNSDEKEGFVAVDTVRNCVWGYNPVHRIYQGWGEKAGFSGWFVVQFQRPIRSFGVKDTVAYVTLDVRAGEMVLAKAATSFTGIDGAWRNLQAEISSWNFLGTRLALDSIWQEQLKTIEVESDDEAKVNQFYGVLYRSSFLPREMSDVDGKSIPFGLSSNNSSQSSSIIKDPASSIHSSTKGNDRHITPLPPGEGSGERLSYGDFSMWDIYRAQMPLLHIIAPRRAADMARSLVDMYRQGGWMPIFPCWNSYTAAMIGDHVSSVIADIVAKAPDALSREDLEKAYEGLRKNAFESPKTMEEYKNGMGRRALKSYLRYGYIPMEDSVMEAFHTHEQVSRTLEYAYDDFCVAQIAKTLDRTEDYRQLMARANNWRNVINPRTGWADGRTKSGRWLNNRDFTSRVPFITEGAVVHYSFYVPHDVYGLSDAMGGHSAFISKLDTLSGFHNVSFGNPSPSPVSKGQNHLQGKSANGENKHITPLLSGEGQGGEAAQGSFYWHGNEPCHHISYLYAWAGQPWKTQKWVHQILQTEYLDVAGGLSGNDDAGQMSAWYVFSALGFYPVCPGTPYYIIGTPMFRRARIGRLAIEAPEVSDENIYIQSATWNGEPYTKNYITHDMITRGGTLRFTMGPTPNTAWGSGKDDLPPIFNSN